MTPAVTPADRPSSRRIQRAQEGVISVEQRNWVLREVARRNGFLQRRALSSNNFGGSNLSLHALDQWLDQ